MTCLDPNIVLVLSAFLFILVSPYMSSGNEKIPLLDTAHKMRDTEDIFEVNGTEYILTSNKVSYEEGVRRCVDNYKGRLALISTEELADFIAIALSETNSVNLSVWIGGKTENNVSRTLYWFDADKRLDKLNQNVLKFVDTRKVNNRYAKFTWVSANESLTRDMHKLIKIHPRYQKVVLGMDCLSIDRIFLDIPRFLPDSCSQLKPTLCERQGPTQRQAVAGSTHHSWIKINKKYFKIFHERISWEQASNKCTQKGAVLATLSNFQECQILGRYLMIGRPNLKNAWIGAKYESSYFTYSNNNETLSNVATADNFPPWRNGQVQRRRGCLVLDREVSFQAAFVEVLCIRQRAYICSRSDPGAEEDTIAVEDKDIDNKIDITIDDITYRLYYQKFSWKAARDKCNRFKEKYGGHLIEIRDIMTIRHLLHVMGSNLTAFRNLWIGGRYDEKEGSWRWDSDNSEISLETSLGWVKNESFHQEAESENKCLNMDRENDDEAFHYGTRCSWGQFFVCTFSRKAMEELHASEVVTT